jgi:hypothetical protein
MRIRLLALVTVLVLNVPGGARAQMVAAGIGYRRPATLTDGWKTASAESRGMDSAALGRLTAAIRGWPELGVHATLIERSGHLIYEEYFDGFDERWGTPLGPLQRLHDRRDARLPDSP